jgi:hypothetical protein
MQAWLLAKADILLLMGRPADALDVGLQALGRDHPILHSPFFAGEFARWLALTSRETRREDEARAEIAGLIDVLETFDAIDQVEILCASSVLDHSRQFALDSAMRLIAKKLAALPSAITQQLERLGVLSQYCPPECNDAHLLSSALPQPGGRPTHAP